MARQFEQLVHVIAHAHRTVPFYAQVFSAALDAVSRDDFRERWCDVPLLTRRDIQSSGNQLYSSHVPAGHGNVASTATSGSTNAPVVTLRTDLTELFWRALTLRDHLWHRRDFSQPFAAIRYTPDQGDAAPGGRRFENWGPATQDVVATGPAFLLDVRSPIEEQARWLMRVDPSYVLGYPSALLGVSQVMEANGWQLSRLREIRTFGEILELQCRATCERVFGVKVVDMYSSQEVGYIALQCPEHEHYHVQSENLLVEVLRNDGRPCRAGEIGKVVITTLHNFAMPLLRYDIGDYAERGDVCPCGRGLPVLTRILGRQRNLLVLPDGSRRWPIFDAGERPQELPPFFQYQVIQRGSQEIDVLVVRDKPLTSSEEQRIQRYMQQTLGHPFTITVRHVDAIQRSRTGKFEDFICEL